MTYSPMLRVVERATDSWYRLRSEGTTFGAALTLGQTPTVSWPAVAKSRRKADSERRHSSAPCGCEVALETGVGPGPIYNEEAFHYFLANERTRSAVSRRPFLVLLMELPEVADQRRPHVRSVGSRIFPALSACLRETDIVGWYREQRVAGAVLTNITDAVPSVQAQIRERVKSVVAKVAGQFSTDMPVRVFQPMAISTRRPGSVNAPVIPADQPRQHAMLEGVAGDR